MAFTIALAGKGGTGKTTAAALVVRALTEMGARSVLAVAGPGTSEQLGLTLSIARACGMPVTGMVDRGCHRGPKAPPTASASL